MKLQHGIALAGVIIAGAGLWMTPALIVHYFLDADLSEMRADLREIRRDNSELRQDRNDLHSRLGAVECYSYRSGCSGEAGWIGRPLPY